jgi:diadenosine tetraphosphate (Ap4A) HIT family hydrolase
LRDPVTLVIPRNEIPSLLSIQPNPIHHLIITVMSIADLHDFTEEEQRDIEAELQEGFADIEDRCATRRLVGGDEAYKQIRARHARGF